MAEPLFDPWDPAHRPDPHPLYHRMREQAPVFRAAGPLTGRGFWFLTRYADVQRALRDPALGRDFERLPAELAARHRQAQGDVLATLDRHVLNLDPPDHTRLRRLMTPAFGARTVAALERRVKEVTAELLDAMAAAGGWPGWRAGLRSTRCCSGSPDSPSRSTRRSWSGRRT